MSLAHSGSRLSLKNMTPVLPEGMILFPLDGRVQDTRNEIPILLNTTTVRDDEKKFFASIAVEDATTNIITNFAWILSKSNYQGTVTETTGSTPFNRSFLFQFQPRQDPSSPGWQVAECMLPAGLTWDTNAKYTVSFYVRSYTPELGNLVIAIRQPNGLEDVMANVSYTPTRDWTRFTYTFTPLLATTSQAVCIYIMANESHKFEVADPQVEKLDHATSWVNGSRGVGSLKYDISALGMRDAGCVSFWVYNSDAMINNKVTNGISSNNQYLVKLGSTSSDWYKDAVTIRVPNSSPRRLQFWTIKTQGTEEHILDSTTLLTGLGVGSWIHVVFQWDKNGLPSGNTKELYVNGKLEAYGNTTYLPQNVLTYLHVGDWGYNAKLMPATLFEQLAIHPSKGFAPEVIENWYNAQAPFFDVKDQLFFY